MKTIYRFFAIIGFSVASLAVAAQNTYSGYFLENYNYRYQLNPAFGNSKNFISMPAIGNLNVSFNGNIDLKDILYNVDGQTVLFTNPKVPVDRALCNLHTDNRLNFDTRINILSAGFKAMGGYNTISISARADVNLSVPYSMFQLAKQGATNDTYDIKNLNANGLGYAELALQHSHTILPGFKIGAAVKFLMGFANVEANFNRADLVLGENDWTATTDADVYVNLAKFAYKHKYNDKNGREYVSGIDMDGEGNYGPNGFGVAFDLGASYEIGGLQLSAAVLDLGFISFHDTKYASTNGVQTISTDAYHFNASDDAPNSFSKEWDNLVGDFDKLYQLTDNGNIGAHTRSLAATLNVGVGYKLPFYKRLNIGLLSTTRINGQYTWTEGRFSANINPVNCLSAGVNVAVGTYGTSFGWLFNLYTTGINFFAGMDYTCFNVSKQYVPLGNNFALNVGLNFPF